MGSGDGLRNLIGRRGVQLGTGARNARYWWLETQEETMKRVMLAGVAMVFATSVFAQTPTTTTTVVVGNGVFKTRAEAETGMKTVKVCTN